MTSQRITIYCFPGQGSDRRIFDGIKLDPRFQLRIIEYATPSAGQTLKEFAKELCKKIDTSERFILLGHSLGGMICVEIAEILDPLATIIISSAKNRNELPLSYRFQNSIPLYKLFPGSILLAGAKFLQPLVEPDRNKYKEIFKSMLAAKTPEYMKGTIRILLTWERVNNTKTIFQIHGDCDRTIPVRNLVSPDHVIKGGSHMMVLTRGEEISTVIDGYLCKSCV